MRELFTNGLLNLASGQAVSGIATAPQTLRIRSGRVWITVEGSRHDYWLFAGDSITLAPGALTVIEADGADSRMELAATGRGSKLPGWQSRLHHLARLLQRFGRSRGAAAALSQSAVSTCESC